VVIPLRERAVSGSTSFGSGREDVFSPVDGFTPSLLQSETIFDGSHFNHTHLSAYASYKFASDRFGYSIGGERPIFNGPRLFLGAEAHDLTTSDDLWRVTPIEQSLAAGGVKNSFRDYYRRRGAQVFAAFSAGENNEFHAIARWDRHQPLENGTSYSFFRDDAAYRANPESPDQQVNAIVLGYTFDTRPMAGAGRAPTYYRHL